MPDSVDDAKTIQAVGLKLQSPGQRPGVKTG